MEKIPKNGAREYGLNINGPVTQKRFDGMKNI